MKHEGAMGGNRKSGETRSFVLRREDKSDPVLFLPAGVPMLSFDGEYFKIRE
jgi:hypothetical protein